MRRGRVPRVRLLVGLLLGLSACTPATPPPAATDAPPRARAEQPRVRRDPAPAPPTVDGAWRLSTFVLSATRPSAIGTRGNYRLRLGGGRAEVVKIGYGTHTWSPAERPHGRAAASEPGPDGDVEIAVDLHGSPARAVGIEFHLWRVGDELRGWWRYRGAQWDAPGFWGVLRGVADEGHGEITVDPDDQPCPVRCAMALDVPRRRAEGRLDIPLWDACRSWCRDDPRATFELAAQPVPEKRHLRWRGPLRTVAALCASGPVPDVDGLEFTVTACARLPSGNRDHDEPIVVRPSRGALPPSIRELAFVHVVSETGIGERQDLTLAIRTHRGWYFSEPLAMSYSGAFGVSGTLERAAATVSDALGPDTIVVSAVSEQYDADLGDNVHTRDRSRNAFVCHVDRKGRPACWRMGMRWRSSRGPMFTDAPTDLCEPGEDPGETLCLPRDYFFDHRGGEYVTRGLGGTWWVTRFGRYATPLGGPWSKARP